MIVRFVMKDAHVPASIQETMNKRCHQRMDAYFKDEAPDATVITACPLLQTSFLQRRTVLLHQ